MKHIKTRMLLFTSMAIFLSCLFITLISTAAFSRLYLKELYLSCESQARQILQGVDQKVQAVEDSMQLILTSQAVVNSLAQTDFNHPDGQVFQTYRDTDLVLKSFQQQFPQFMGMIFYNSNDSYYWYNYYNPNLKIWEKFLAPEYIQDISKTDQFNWEGVYLVDNQIAKENAYIVTRSFVDYQNLKNLGVALILLEEDVFSSIYQPMVETSGASVYLFDETGAPVESYEKAALDEVREILPNGRQSDQIFQTKAKDGQSLLTTYCSSETGWMICVQIPIRVLTNSMRNLIVFTILISMCIVIFFGIIMFRYISHITNEIVRVSDAMQVVEENHFSLRLHTNRKDEIGLIYAGFNTMAENLGKYFHKAMEEEKSKNQAEIRAMFYQIKPHFLYNTLASIRMYAMKQGCGEIVDMLGTLNRLLRNTINIRDHFIPLKEELDNLKDYIKIYNVRYNNQIQFSIEVPDELLSYRIPNMIIQPMVENAIEHGVSGNIASETQPACIEIKAFRQDNILLIQVRDNGAGMSDMELSAVMEASSDTEEAGHIGIHNIDSRLKILYGDGYGVHIESEKNQYTCVTLKIPMQEQEDRR